MTRTVTNELQKAINELILKIANDIREHSIWTEQESKNRTDNDDILIWTGIEQGLENAWNIVMEYYSEDEDGDE